MGFPPRPQQLPWLLPVLLIPLLLLPGCRSSEEQIADHMAKAEAFRAEGRDQDAIIEYRAVLGLDPQLVGLRRE